MVLHMLEFLSGVRYFSSKGFSIRATVSLSLIFLQSPKKIGTLQYFNYAHIGPCYNAKLLHRVSYAILLDACGNAQYGFLGREVSGYITPGRVSLPHICFDDWHQAWRKNMCC
jgi:hypothetical protein